MRGDNSIKFNSVYLHANLTEKGQLQSEHNNNNNNNNNNFSITLYYYYYSFYSLGQPIDLGHIKKVKHFPFRVPRNGVGQLYRSDTVHEAAIHVIVRLVKYKKKKCIWQRFAQMIINII
jgi:hypothetical protein